MDTPENTDAHFEGSKLIRVSPDDVYDYVSRIENLSSYLAMVTEASDAGDDRIHMTVDLHGRKEEDTGVFRQIPSDRRLEWGSEEGDYNGWMTVVDEDGQSRLTMHLAWAAESPFPEVMEDAAAKEHPADDAIEAALESVKNILEGTGGAVHPDEAEA